jgi:hypothetical protein
MTEPAAGVYSFRFNVTTIVLALPHHDPAAAGRRPSRSGWATAVLAAVWLVAAGCSTPPPTVPTPPPPPQAPPPNPAPVVSGISVDVTVRTEVETDVAVSVAVTDGETPVDTLTYQWTATAGTITGSGRSVSWRMAKGAATTPVNVTISVAVLEPYSVLENGVIVMRQHRVEASAAPFRVHDSDAEVRGLVLAFLAKFVNNNVSAAQAVSDFSDSCPGKQDELSDVSSSATPGRWSAPRSACSR